jgi:GMP synthase (glutamine-hydrolysing)
MKVHFVVHESFEAPGAYETWVKERGFEAGYSRVYDHEPLPRSIDDIDLLVVMGGPQSPSTTREECPHFDAAAECALIARCVDGGKAVGGVWSVRRYATTSASTASSTSSASASP